MTETIREVEQKKRQLEENVDSLNEECAQLKASRKKFSSYFC
jgi:prefoldin subunit 5